MKRFSEQFKKESERLSLKTAERTVLKERVLSYMEYHPLPAHLKTASSADRIFTESYTAVRFNIREWQKMIGVCAVMVMIVVPFAAERTAPGDVLYPVKVRFTEEVRSTFTFSTYEKVEWETKRLERRLAEARLLASEGKLTEEVQAEVALAVKNHSEAAQKELAVLRESDSEEAAIAQLAFASSIEAQTEALSSTVVKAGNTSVASEAITTALSTAYAATQQENNIPSFARLLAKVELETTRAYELFNSLEATKNTPAHRDIERRLADINRKLEKSIALASGESESTITATLDSSITTASPEDVASGTQIVATGTQQAVTHTILETNDEVRDTTDAVTLLREVLQSTQKLVLYMSDLELAAYVTVDELVPVTPTDEEQKDAYSRSLALLDTQVTAIENRIGSATNVKIEFGLTEITQSKVQAHTALDNGDFAQALTFLATAHALADDILRLIEVQNIPVPEPETPTSTSTASSATSTTSVATSTDSGV